MLTYLPIAWRGRYITVSDANVHTVDKGRVRQSTYDTTCLGALPRGPGQVGRFPKVICGSEWILKLLFGCIMRTCM